MIEVFLALSHHILPGDWNEIHPGIRYRQDEWVAGVYLNSEDDVSVFGAYDFGNLELGLVTGYEGGNVIPFVRAHYDIDNVSFFASPTFNTVGDFGVVIGVELTVGR